MEKVVQALQNAAIRGKVKISDHQQSWEYEDGPWKGLEPPLLVAADFLSVVRRLELILPIGSERMPMVKMRPKRSPMASLNFHRRCFTMILRFDKWFF